MQGLIGKKVGMTSIFDENGKNIPCTVLQAGPCVVTQIKTVEKDGYFAVQLGFEDKEGKAHYKSRNGPFQKSQIQLLKGNSLSLQALQKVRLKKVK